MRSPSQSLSGVVAQQSGEGRCFRFTLRLVLPGNQHLFWLPSGTNFLAVKLKGASHSRSAIYSSARKAKTPLYGLWLCPRQCWGFRISFHRQLFPGILSQKTHVCVRDILCPVFSGVVGMGSQVKIFQFLFFVLLLLLLNNCIFRQSVILQRLM